MTHSNTNQGSGQYLTHVHSQITRAVAAMDSCFTRSSNMNYLTYTSYHFTSDLRHELNKLTSLSMCGFIAQLVEHRTGIVEVTGSNPVEALIFSGFFFPFVQVGKFTAMNILHFVSALLGPISMAYPSGRNRTKSPM